MATGRATSVIFLYLVSLSLARRVSKRGQRLTSAMTSTSLPLDPNIEKCFKASDSQHKNPSRDYWTPEVCTMGWAMGSDWSAQASSPTVDNSLPAPGSDSPGDRIITQNGIRYFHDGASWRMIVYHGTSHTLLIHSPKEGPFSDWQDFKGKVEVGSRIFLGFPVTYTDSVHSNEVSLPAHVIGEIVASTSNYGRDSKQYVKIQFPGRAEPDKLRKSDWDMYKDAQFYILSGSDSELTTRRMFDDFSSDTPYDGVAGIKGLKGLMQSFDKVSADTTKLQGVTQAFFVTTNPCQAKKYACPSAVGRKELTKVGAVLVEMSVDARLMSAWDNRAGCRGMKGPADMAGVAILRDSKVMDEYFVADGELFKDPSKFRVENVYDLHSGYQYFSNYFPGSFGPCSF